MAHFAKLNANNIVIDSDVVNNSDINDTEFPESEALGIAYLNGIFGELTDGEYYKQTSYNNNFRGKYASIGDTYDSENDIFVPQKPFDSWTWDADLNDWVSPVAMPVDGQTYVWNDNDMRWEVDSEGVNYRWDEDTNSWVQSDSKEMIP